MADGLSLLGHDGQMILRVALVVVVAILRTSVIVPALIQKELCHGEVLLIASDQIELDQAHLDLLMAGDITLFVNAEGSNHVIRTFDCHVEQAAFAGGLIVRHRTFVQWPTL